MLHGNQIVHSLSSRAVAAVPRSAVLPAVLNVILLISYPGRGVLCRGYLCANWPPKLVTDSGPGARSGVPQYSGIYPRVI